MPRGGDLENVSGRCDSGTRLGCRTFRIRRYHFGGQQFGNGQGKFSGVPCNPGRKAQCIGLAVCHGQRGGGPNVGLMPAAVGHCLKQLLLGAVPRCGQYKLVHHCVLQARAIHEVVVDAKDVGLQLR